MTQKILKATHIGEINIGDKTLSCAVLEDGTRVVTMSAVFKAFNRPVRSRIKAGDRVINMPSFLDAKNLQPFVSNELMDVIKPITYISKNGKETQGYDSNILPLLCDVYLEARKAQKVLTKKQIPLAEASEILVRTLSKVGIVALVDEATGFQEVRDRDALQALLDKYLLQEYAKWAKRFPDEFYKQMFRLRGWEWKGMSVNRPSVVGKYTKDLVYQRLAPGVLKELEKLNPKNDSGKRKVKHHQFLSEDIGHPALNQLIFALMGMMRASTTWDQFYRLVQRAYPKKGDNLLLDFED